MPAFKFLLQCVAKAVVRNGGRALAHVVPFGDVLFAIAKDTHAEYCRGHGEDQLRADLQSLAQARPSAVTEAANEVAAQVAAGQSPRAQQALAMYLTQVPAAVRRSLRRPSDPAGITLPAGCCLRKAEDLLPFLPPNLPRFQPGQCPLANVDLQLVELLGVGGFGEVWKATNPNMPNGEPVALKFCLDAQAAQVLRNEATLLDRVMRHGRHPGIVQLRRTYLSADPPCLEYELVAGGDLAGLIQEWHQSNRSVSPATGAKVMLSLAEIVGFAHSQSPPIVHRDLKPANILVQQGQDGRLKLRVADFGIGGLAASHAVEMSRISTQGNRMVPTAVRGSYTPLYASPHQMRGEPPDPRDDVYSLGVIWYQMLTGDLNSGAPSGLQWSKELIKRGMSESQIELLASCVEPRSEDRPANAMALAQQLQTTAKAPDEVIDTELADEVQRWPNQTFPAKSSGPTGRASSNLAPVVPAQPAVEAQMTASWYYHKNGKPVGPIDFGSLRRLLAEVKITGETLVWREGMRDWKEAHRVDGLFPKQIPQLLANPANEEQCPNVVMAAGGVSQRAHHVRLRDLLQLLLEGHRKVTKGKRHVAAIALTIIAGLLLGGLAAGLAHEIAYGSQREWPVGIVVFFMTALASYLWRCRQQAAAVRTVEETSEKIARDYPEDVKSWGGKSVLDNATLVHEFLRMFEKAERAADS